MHPLQPGAGYS